MVTTKAGSGIESGGAEGTRSGRVLARSNLTAVLQFFEHDIGAAAAPISMIVEFHGSI